MQRDLNGHVVDVPHLSLDVHLRGAGYPTGQVHREVMPLSGEARPRRDGRVVSEETHTRHTRSASKGNLQNLCIYIHTPNVYIYRFLRVY